MSREEAEQEETKSKSDDMRLQLALAKSKEEGGPDAPQGLGYGSQIHIIKTPKITIFQLN